MNKDELIRKRDQLNEEIRCYPTPIPRCDQQFNFLIEERARIVEALAKIGNDAGKNP